MVLNIFPRKAPAAAEPTPTPEASLPEPSPEVMEQIEGDAARPTRRGSRGGRSRTRSTAAATAEVEGGETAESAEETPAAAPARAPRRSSRAKAADATDEAPSAEASEVDPRPRRGTPRQQAQMKAREEAAAAAGIELEPAAPPARGKAGAGTDGAIMRALEQQGRQIEALMEAVRRSGGSIAGGAGAPPARVGVFVDAANVELASDRLRAHFDWAKILAMLTKDRTLVRAIAYSPVHDDPGVSIETQRFVEPFLGKGYKVVTKPLKRFQDGTIKANVDIEMALDVIEMLDRLDVVCLVSGDGDFQRLVEVVQAKGVRVEVVAVGNSAAGALRNAADEFIDLQQRLRDVRV